MSNSTFNKSLLLSSWLVLLLFLFWVFFARAIHPFGQEKQLEYQPSWAFKNQQIDQLLAQLALERQGNIILHLVDPECSCSRFSINYIQSVIRDKKLSDYDQYVFIPPGKSAEDFKGAILLSNEQYQLLKQFIPSTPAALIWYQAKHQVAFIGAHTTGEICGQGQSNLNLVASNLKQNNNPDYFPFLQRGCFCAT